MGKRSAKKSPGNVRKFYIDRRVVTLSINKTSISIAWYVIEACMGAEIIPIPTCPHRF